MLIGWDYAYCGFPWFSICLVFCHCLVKPFDFHQNRIPKRESTKGSQIERALVLQPAFCQRRWVVDTLGDVSTDGADGMPWVQAWHFVAYMWGRGVGQKWSRTIWYENNSNEIKRCDIKYISWYGDMKYYEYDIWYTDTRSHEMTVVKRHAWPNES